MPLEDLQPPSAMDMARASGVSKQAAADWRSYCNKCVRRAGMLEPRLLSHFPEGLDDARGLDWGCAAGGVAILLAEKFPLQMHAADVDEHSIAWLQQAAPGIKATVLPGEPPLPWEDDHFDFVYGISVLTHVPAGLQEPYLAELARIGRPGALVVLTVASYYACEKNRSGESASRIAAIDVEELRKQGVIYREYSDRVLEQMDFARNVSYGMTVHSREYVETVFGRYFTLVNIEEGGLGYQDVVTLGVP